MFGELTKAHHVKFQKQFGPKIHFQAFVTTPNCALQLPYQAA